jgi:bacitracin export ATP-binding protein bceA
MILQGKNLEKSYNNAVLKTQVLKGVDIEIEEGEFVSIMGKFGSGKSTLLNILSSLDVADKGRIVFEERDISKLFEEEAAKLRRKSFGFVFRLRKISEYILLLK